MTKTSKTTKIAAMMLTIAMLLGMLCIVGATNASAATDRVKLYSSAKYFVKYGFTTSEVYVRTQDNAQNQQVFVHYRYLNDANWLDTEATYVTTMDDGSKIWRATFSSLDTRYAIKYVADGEEIWDNNNGNDYTLNDVLGAAPIVSERLFYQYNGLYGFKINAVLQNYAYQKNVFVRYTTDGWKSYQDKALTYDKTNANGTETWTVNISNNNASATDFQYAICYQVNGTEFWTNNFGKNYDGNYHIYQ